MSKNNFLSLRNLTKTYPKERSPALRNVSFDIEEGEIFGLLGPNGAGKSTAINIIAGLLSSDEGEILLQGKDFSEIRNSGEIRMNISTAYSSLPYPLTVEQNLKIFSYLYGITNKEEQINEV
jgi:ABC-2 type transport system ATP-binding protein